MGRLEIWRGNGYARLWRAAGTQASGLLHARGVRTLSLLFYFVRRFF